MIINTVAQYSIRLMNVLDNKTVIKTEMNLIHSHVPFKQLMSVQSCSVCF